MRKTLDWRGFQRNFHVPTPFPRRQLDHDVSCNSCNLLILQNKCILNTLPRVFHVFKSTFPAFRAPSPLWMRLPERSCIGYLSPVKPPPAPPCTRHSPRPERAPNSAQARGNGKASSHHAAFAMRQNRGVGRLVQEPRRSRQREARQRVNASLWANGEARLLMCRIKQ